MATVKELEEENEQLKGDKVNGPVALMNILFFRINMNCLN